MQNLLFQIPLNDPSPIRVYEPVEGGTGCHRREIVAAAAGMSAAAVAVAVAVAVEAAAAARSWRKVDCSDLRLAVGRADRASDAPQTDRAQSGR